MPLAFAGKSEQPFSLQASHILQGLVDGALAASAKPLPLCEGHSLTLMHVAAAGPPVMLACEGANGTAGAPTLVPCTAIVPGGEAAAAAAQRTEMMVCVDGSSWVTFFEKAEEVEESKVRRRRVLWHHLSSDADQVLAQSLRCSLSATLPRLRAARLRLSSCAL